MNPGESYDPLLMSPVQSTSISVDEGEEKDFLSLETIETWIVYVNHSEGEWARQSAFEQGVVVGSRHTSLRPCPDDLRPS